MTEFENKTETKVEDKKQKLSFTGLRISGLRRDYKGFYKLYKFGTSILKVYEPNFSTEKEIVLTQEIYNKVKKEN